MNTRALLLTLAASGLAAPAFAIDVEVPSASYPNLNIALSRAVADGIETITLLDQQPGDTADVIGSFDLSIAGKRITLQGEPGANVIVDAFGTGSVFEVKSSSLDDTIIRNLTLRGGQALRGGGIDFNANIDLFLEDVRFANNGANAPSGIGTTDRGGAISLGFPASGSGVAGGRLHATDCLFSGNDATLVGGAIYANGYDITLLRCVFDDNACPRVPAMDPVPADGTGGAIFLNNTGLVCDQSTFSNNFAADQGGAVQISSSSTATFRRTEFLGNNAGRAGSPEGRGGAYYSLDGRNVDVINCLFADNRSEYFGPAIYSVGDSDIVHSTFAGNVSGNASGSAIEVPTNGTLRMSNCILRGSLDSFSGAGAKTIRHTNFVGSTGTVGAPNSGGNFDGDPAFADPANGDYRLAAGSPCIDAGDSLADTGNVVQVDILEDFDGSVRGVGDPNTPNTGVSTWTICVDMGAFEFQAAEPCGPSDCVADVTTTGATLAGQAGFGQPDGAVDADDLGYFLNFWLEGCP